MKWFREASRDLRQMVMTNHSLLVHLPWWQTSIAGYLIGILLVALVVLGIRFFMIYEVHLLWLPFCLVSVLVGSVWGVSPALLATLLGFLAFNYIIIPQSDTLTFNIWSDLKIIGPFVLAQFCIVFLAAQNAVKHRRSLIARQELNTYALELTELNRQLALTNEDLEKARHLQEDFITRAAHQLRTPLTTLLGETQLAIRRLHKQGTLTPEQQICQQHFTRIEDRALVLRALIEDLIILNALRADETFLRKSLCDFSAICREAVAQQRARSEHPIELKLPPDPLILHADRERLAQMSANLLSNALSYLRDKATLYVCVRAKPSCVFLHVSIADFVISTEQQAQLFEPFYRIPYLQSSSQKGWEPGLTISREIIQRHGGRIRVQSNAGQGTMFSVLLPC